MYHTNIYCERYHPTPQIIATILHKLSTNNYGSIYVNNNVTFIIDKSGAKLQYRNKFEPIMNKSISHISCSEEWIFIQKILNQLDEVTKLYITDILNSYPSKLLLIISAILSFPENCDIKCLMLSHFFVNLDEPIKMYTWINNKWTLFCVSFGNTCNYLYKFKAREHVMKKLINYFVTTKMN